METSCFCAITLGSSLHHLRPNILHTVSDLARARLFQARASSLWRTGEHARGFYAFYIVLKFVWPPNDARIEGRNNQCTNGTMMAIAGCDPVYTSFWQFLRLSFDTRKCSLWQTQPPRTGVIFFLNNNLGLDIVFKEIRSKERNIGIHEP